MSRTATETPKASGIDLTECIRTGVKPDVGRLGDVQFGLFCIEAKAAADAFHALPEVKPEETTLDDWGRLEEWRRLTMYFHGLIDELSWRAIDRARA